MQTKSRWRYFYEAVRHGSMRAASEHLDVAPSSVSRQIALLEEELGVLLIERGRRSIKLTEAGELAVAHYREQRSAEETFFSKIDDIRGLRRGTVVLGMGEGFVGSPFAKTLDRFMDEFPDIRLVVEMGKTNEVLALLKADDAHVGIIFDAQPDPRISIHASSRQPLQAVVPPGHPLAGRKSVRVQELADYPIALPKSSFRIRQILDDAAAAEGVFLAPVLTSNSLLLLKNFVCSGYGITVLPDAVVREERKAGELTAVGIRNDTLSRTAAHIVARLGRQLPVAANTLLIRLKRYFSRLDASAGDRSGDSRQEAKALSGF